MCRCHTSRFTPASIPENMLTRRAVSYQYCDPRCLPLPARPASYHRRLCSNIPSTKYQRRSYSARSSGDVIGCRRFGCVASRNKVATVVDGGLEDEEKEDAEDERKDNGE